MDNPPKFIIIDDDPVNNTICRLSIQRALGKRDIKTLSSAESGLEYIQSAFSKTESTAQTILLLDINMPTMTGWDFLEEYDRFTPEIKKAITIYIVSSSLDARDIERAHANTYVIDYLVKPLSYEIINRISNAAVAGTF
jgi:CheY-like chemotaxis protein